MIPLLCDVSPLSVREANRRPSPRAPGVPGGPPAPHHHRGLPRRSGRPSDSDLPHIPYEGDPFHAR